MTLGFAAIPLVDLAEWTSATNDAERTAFADRFVDVCHRVGFLLLVGHGVENEYVDLPGFQSSVEGFMSTMSGIASTLMTIISRGLGLADDHLHQVFGERPLSLAPGAFAINLGEMLQEMTGNYLVATTHRVITSEPRYSCAYFHGPDLRTNLDRLPLEHGTPSRRRVKN
jgi:isopenicillin N synthase-like dioxygenase